MPEAKTHLNGSVRYCDTAYAVAEGSDALVVGTGWPEFRALDFDRIRCCALYLVQLRADAIEIEHTNSGHPVPTTRASEPSATA